MLRIELSVADPERSGGRLAKKVFQFQKCKAIKKWITIIYLGLGSDVGRGDTINVGEGRSPPSPPRGSTTESYGCVVVVFEII